MSEEENKGMATIDPDKLSRSIAEGVYHALYPQNMPNVSGPLDAVGNLLRIVGEYNDGTHKIKSVEGMFYDDLNLLGDSGISEMPDRTPAGSVSIYSPRSPFTWLFKYLVLPCRIFEEIFNNPKSFKVANDTITDLRKEYGFDKNYNLATGAADFYKTQISGYASAYEFADKYVSDNSVKEKIKGKIEETMPLYLQSVGIDFDEESSTSTE